MMCTRSTGGSVRFGHAGTYPRLSLGDLDEGHRSGVSSLDKCTLTPSAAARFTWHAAGHLQARSRTVTISGVLRALDAFQQETRRHSARPSRVIVAERRLHQFDLYQCLFDLYQCLGGGIRYFFGERSTLRSCFWRMRSYGYRQGSPA
jgi:hypothetical protein